MVGLMNGLSVMPLYVLSSKIIVSLVDKETEEVSRALFEKLLSKEGVSDLGGTLPITDKV